MSPPGGIACRTTLAGCWRGGLRGRIRGDGHGVDAITVKGEMSLDFGDCRIRPGNVKNRRIACLPEYQRVPAIHDFNLRYADHDARVTQFNGNRVISSGQLQGLGVQTTTPWGIREVCPPARAFVPHRARSESRGRANRATRGISRPKQFPSSSAAQQIPGSRDVRSQALPSGPLELNVGSCNTWTASVSTPRFASVNRASAARASPWVKYSDFSPPAALSRNSSLISRN